MAVIAQITVGHIRIMDVNANPNGTVSAPKGSLASDEVAAILYINTDGAMAWSPVSGTSSLDPRDIFRFSMFHNVGVTGGG
jgi:hypothetical protein